MFRLVMSEDAMVRLILISFTDLGESWPKVLETAHCLRSLSVHYFCWCVLVVMLTRILLFSELTSIMYACNSFSSLVASSWSSVSLLPMRSMSQVAEWPAIDGDWCVDVVTCLLHNVFQVDVELGRGDLMNNKERMTGLDEPRLLCQRIPKEFSKSVVYENCTAWVLVQYLFHFS